MSRSTVENGGLDVSQEQMMGRSGFTTNRSKNVSTYSNYDISRLVYPPGQDQSDAIAELVDHERLSKGSRNVGALGRHSSILKTQKDKEHLDQKIAPPPPPFSKSIDKRKRSHFVNQSVLLERRQADWIPEGSPRRANMTYITSP